MKFSPICVIIAGNIKFNGAPSSLFHLSLIWSSVVLNDSNFVCYFFPFSTPIEHDEKTKRRTREFNSIFQFFLSLFLPLIYLHTMKSNMKHSRVRSDKPPTEQFVCWGWNEIHQNVSIKQNTKRTAPLEIRNHRTS